MILSRLLDAWNNFWFAPQSPLPMAAFRIACGIMLLQSAIWLLPQAEVWYGPQAILRPGSVPHIYLTSPVVLNLLNAFPQSMIVVYLLFFVFIVASVCLALGWRTRLSAIIVWLCLTTLYHRNPLNMNSGDTYIRQMVFWLMFGGEGQVLSLDKFFQDKKQKLAPFCPLVSCWPQRMMQLQLCFVYAHSFFTKIVAPYWLDGTAVYYSTRLIELRKFGLPFVFDQLWSCQLLTWLTLLLEFAFFTFIWLKPLRYPIILLAVVFHLILDWTFNIPQFEWLMIIGFLLFFDNKDIQNAIDLLTSKFNQWSIKLAN